MLSTFSARSGIYRIRHRKTRNCYIGSATRLGRRLTNHRSYLRRGIHPNKHLQSAWNKYGADAFVFEVFLVCAPLDLLFYEQRALDVLKPSYNKSPTASSNRGATFPTLRGKKRPFEVGRKISAALTGKSLSPAHRAALSAAKKGKPPPVGFRRPAGNRPAAEYDSRRGRKRDPESIRNSAAMRRGQKRTLQQRQRMSTAALAMDPSVRARIDAARTVTLRANGWTEERRARFIAKMAARYEQGWSPWKAHNERIEQKC